jgi:hypothetical protein
MSRMVGVLVLLLWWSALACSQGTPTIVQWISIWGSKPKPAEISDGCQNRMNLSDACGHA